jgi:hypothetical protein
MIAPHPKQPTQTAMAVARWRGSRNRVTISERVDGDTTAPAIPSTARLAISISGLFAYAAATDAALNSTAPVSRSFRRPIRSPSVPIVIMKPATMKP